MTQHTRRGAHFRTGEPSVCPLVSLLGGRGRSLVTAGASSATPIAITTYWSDLNYIQAH
ncbi:MAG: hypothetical protein RL518_1105 [Pseudomonadota bacterium]|jgi:hypothetical protein